MPAYHGETVQLCSDPNIDRLFSMVFALAAELTAVSEELDTLKRVVVQHNVITGEQIAGFMPSPEAAAERDRARRNFVTALMSSLEQEITPRENRGHPIAAE